LPLNGIRGKTVKHAHIRAHTHVLSMQAGEYGAVSTNYMKVYVLDYFLTAGCAFDSVFVYVETAYLLFIYLFIYLFIMPSTTIELLWISVYSVDMDSYHKTSTRRKATSWHRNTSVELISTNHVR
jgi:hypothetical protein